MIILQNPHIDSYFTMQEKHSNSYTVVQKIDWKFPQTTIIKLFPAQPEMSALPTECIVFVA